MLFAVLLEDDPRHADQRACHMDAHLRFLEANQDRIQAAGPLIAPEEGQAGGGLWLVEAESAEEVRGLVETDPFWPTGLRKSVRILEWRRVFSEGRRLG